MDPYILPIHSTSEEESTISNEIRQRIIREAAELFHAKGYRHVTLNELAAQLGMSKKTLYQFFSGKEDIAEAVLDQTMRTIAGEVEQVLKGGGDPLVLLGVIFTGIKEEIGKLSPLFLADIQKHAPAVWARLEAFRGKQLLFLEQLLTRAQKEGQIRDVNVRLASAMMMDTIQRMVRPDFATKQGVTVPEVAETWMVLFLKGLRTDNRD